MQKADFSFEEAKLRIAARFKKLQNLDSIRRKLNEQLFLLDLQQEVSIKRYKRCLQMIGENQQKENNRYILSQNNNESDFNQSLNDFLDETNKKISTISSQRVNKDRIEKVKSKLDQYKKRLNEEKEKFLNLSKQETLLNNIMNEINQKYQSQIESKVQTNNGNNSERVDNCVNQNGDDHINLESLLTKINEEKIKKNNALKRREGLFREVTIMTKIVKELQKQLLILQNQAVYLVEKRKWRPNSQDNYDHFKDSKFTVSKSSLSIP